jgi:hypothetical protein
MVGEHSVAVKQVSKDLLERSEKTLSALVAITYVRTIRTENLRFPASS